ncbi:double-stranded RNA-binding motif protein [Rhizoctonia solani]|uniref:Double-stranded RNA-binding motif protein n=1 Tax=Rhizoctonia solani TaxID=456999 RepID=A0A8H8P6L0_9AGAM|nr:double-stranded RNA-binding motif protein [Rhizoctonia solani]QRW24816.1 double-stranded RNA-binding motif protein [Rhizoctonia solani]
MIPPHMQPPHSLHARFSPYSPGPGGPVHTSSPAALAHPQPQYNVNLPRDASQTVYPTQPPLGAMPPGGYPAMGIGPNSGFAPPAPGPAPAPVAAPQQTQGFSLINEMAMKNRRSVSWQQAKVGQQHMPEWTMWLFLDGELRGQGTAPTKQAAKELASKAALQALGWIQG